MSDLPKNKIALLLLLLGNATLLGLNLWLYPLGNGRDELDHWRLVNFYDQHRRPPVLPQDLGAASVQGHQPPLYYLMASLLVSPVDLDACYELNPFLLTGNYIENLPRYNRVLFVEKTQVCAAMGWRLRAFSVVLTLLGLALLYDAFCRMGFEKEALLALAFLSLTPSFWRTSITISNNQLLFFWVAGLWWLMACGKKLKHWLPVGLLVKLYALPLLLFFFPRKKQISVGFVLVAAWYLRNGYLYGDPSGIRITEKLLVSGRVGAYSLGDYARALFTLWGELWLESWTLINTSESLYLASGIGWLLLVSHLAAWRRNPPSLNALSWGMAAPVLLMALYAEGRNLHAAYSAPLLIPALPALALAFANGLLAWASPRITLAAMLLIALGSGLFHVQYFLPLFPPPASAWVENRLAVDFENGMRLTGFTLAGNHFQAGDMARVKLCWEAQEKIGDDYAFTVKFLHPNRPNAAHLDGYPLSGRVLTRHWEVGKSVCEWLNLRVKGESGDYFLFVGLFHPIKGQVFYHLPDSRRDNYLLLARVRVD